MTRLLNLSIRGALDRSRPHALLVRHTNPTVDYMGDWLVRPEWIGLVVAIGGPTRRPFLEGISVVEGYDVLDNGRARFHGEAKNSAALGLPVRWARGPVLKVLPIEGDEIGDFLRLPL